MIITVFNDKGGVTKSTTVINLGVSLAQQGKSVLLIDADKQGHLSRLWLEFVDDQKPTLANMILDEYTGVAGNPASCIRHHEQLHLDYIPSNTKLEGINRILDLCPDPQNVLATALGNPFFKRYDYILIDNQATYDLWVGNTFKAANKILIPTEAERSSFEAIEKTLEKVKTIKQRDDIDKYIGGIIVTKFQGYTKACKEYYEKIEQTYPDYLLSPTIPYRSEEKLNLKSSIVAATKKSSDIGKAYRQITEELLKK